MGKKIEPKHMQKKQKPMIREKAQKIIRTAHEKKPQERCKDDGVGRMVGFEVCF